MWDNTEKQGNFKKFHTQFGHPRSEQLIELMKNSGIEDEKFLKIVDTVKNFETCKIQKKQKPRPVVVLLLAKGFNDVSSVDLKDVETQIQWMSLSQQACGARALD